MTTSHRLEHKENCRTECDVEGLPACDCGADEANAAIYRETDRSVIKAIQARFHASYIDPLTRKLIHR